MGSFQNFVVVRVGSASAMLGAAERTTPYNFFESRFVFRWSNSASCISPFLYTVCSFPGHGGVDEIGCDIHALGDVRLSLILGCNVFFISKENLL